MKFKYIQFVESGDKKYPYECLNNRTGHSLGFVGTHWGENCFFPQDGMVFSESCLQDIITTLRTLPTLAVK